MIQSSCLSQISQIIFVEKKLSCGEILGNFGGFWEILGDFATIYALSCGEKMSPKSTFVEKKYKYEVCLTRDTRKMGGALETAPVVAPLRLGSRPILGHLCFGPRFEWNISIQYIWNLFLVKLLKLVPAIAIHQMILAFFKLLKPHKPVTFHCLSLPFRFSLQSNPFYLFLLNSQQ